MSRKPAKKQETGIPLNEEEVHNPPSETEQQPESVEVDKAVEK